MYLLLTNKNEADASTVSFITFMKLMWWMVLCVAEQVVMLAFLFFCIWVWCTAKLGQESNRFPLLCCMYWIKSVETLPGKQTNNPKFSHWSGFPCLMRQQSTSLLYKIIIFIIIKTIIIRIIKLNLNINLFNIIINISLSPVVALPQGTKYFF